MLLAAAVGTLLCAVGTALVFIAAVAGFALLFLGFGAYAVVPFMAWGLAGPGERGAAPPPSRQRRSGRG